MNYIQNSEFIETTCLVCNKQDQEHYDRMGIDFNDWDTAPLCIRKDDVSAFRTDERHTTHVTLVNGVEFVVHMPYEQFKNAMFL